MIKGMRIYVSTFVMQAISFFLVICQIKKIIWHFEIFVDTGPNWAENY